LIQDQSPEDVAAMEQSREEHTYGSQSRRLLDVSTCAVLSLQNETSLFLNLSINHCGDALTHTYLAGYDISFPTLP